MKNKNLTYISSSIIPSRTANSIHVMKMCQAFSKIGYDTTLIASYDRRYIEKNVDNTFDFYGVEKIFETKIVEKIKIPLIKNFFYSYKAHKVAMSINSDIVYGRDLIGCYLMAKRGYEVIYECHSPKFGFVNRLIFKKLLKNKYCLAIVVISDALRKILIKEYDDILKNADLIVAHDGVDLENFEDISKSDARNLLKLQKEKPIIGYTGHLYEGRGIDLIFKLAKINKEYIFMLVGGNKENIKKYKSKADDLELNNIIFAGHVPNSKINIYWKACDILLMPYQKEVSVGRGKLNTVNYMSPLKMFEYLASGIPFVSSDLPVLKEVLENNFNCLLVKCDEVKEWNIAIKDLVNNKEKRAKLSKNALLTSKKHTWKKRAEFIMKKI